MVIINHRLRLVNFNSIKVRLEQCCDTLEPAIVEFQFHKGAIRTKQ